MHFSKTRALKNISTKSLGELTYDEYGQFFFDGISEEVAYQANSLIFAFIRDVIITVACAWDEPIAMGMGIAQESDAYKAFEKKPFTQSIVAWRDYLFYIASKFDFITELIALQESIDGEKVINFYDRLYTEMEEAIDALKTILPRLYLQHND